MPYSRVNWKNGAAGGTPLNQTNLNKMDAGIKDNENAIASTNEEVATNAEAIAANAEAIEELKNKPTSAMLLEGISPLEYATNNNIVGLYAEGKSEQYISPNLLKYTITSGSKNGVNYSVNGGQITLSGKATADTSIIVGTANLESGVAYTLSIRGGAIGGVSVTSGYIGTANISANPTIKTATPSATATSYTQINITNGTTVSGTYTLQIEKGTSASEYSDYTGTPSPTNPIPIKDASGVVEAHNKNLFDKDTYTLNNIGADGTVTPNNNVSCTDYIKVNKDFVLSYNNISSASDTNFRVAFYDGNKTFIKRWYVTNNGRHTYKSSDMCSQEFGYIRCAYDGVNDNYTEVQIELGTTASPYVEYKSNAILIGGNLLDMSKATMGYYILSSNGNLVEGSQSVMPFASDWIDVVGGRTYNIKTLNADKWSSMVFYDSAKKYISGANGRNDDGLTLVAPSNAKYLRCSCNTNGLSSGYILTDDVECFTLRSIGNIADTLTVNEDGSAEWVQKVGVYVVNADSTIASSNKSYAITGILTPTPKIYPNSDKSNIICDRMTTDTANNTYNGVNENTISGFNSDNWYFRFYSSSFTSASDCKNKIMGATIYYELATPIIRTLTKEQVDAIRQLKTYEGTTLIDAELQNVKVKYAGDTKKYVDDKFIYTSDERLIGSYLDAPLYRRVLYGSDNRFDIANINPKFIYGMNEFGETLVPGEDFAIITLMNPSTMERTTQIMLLTGTYHEFIIEYTKYTPSGGVGGSSVAPMALSLDDSVVPAVVPMNTEGE